MTIAMPTDVKSAVKYRTPLREAQRDQMRARIVNAARELFHARHYDTTTMDEIAAAAGMRRSTLYLHYRDKAEILLELITEYGGKAKAMLARLPGPGTSLADLRGWVDDVAAFIASERVPLSIIVEVRRRQGFSETLDQLTNDLLGALGTHHPQLRDSTNPLRRARALMLLQELTYACEVHLEDPAEACGLALLQIAAEDFHRHIAEAHGGA